MSSFLTLRKHLLVCLNAFLLQNWDRWTLSKWNVHYLTDGATSLSQPVHSGVPQGSVCDRSPTVHNLHWWPYQCPFQQLRSMSLCADDILFRTTQSASDYQILQAETDALSDYIWAHKLELNRDKCKCMPVTRKRDSTMPTVLLISGRLLERVSSILKFSQHLICPGQHTSTLCSKAQQQIVIHT